METEDYKLLKMKQKEDYVNIHMQTSITLWAISRQPIQLTTVLKVCLGKGVGDEEESQGRTPEELSLKGSQ